MNSIRHRQLRAWLTLLGIIIGVAAVVSIISIGEGANASIAEQVSGFGADVITVSAGYSKAGMFMGGDRGPPGGLGGDRAAGTSEEAPELGKSDLRTIRANPNISYVNEKVSGRAELVFLSESINTTITGVNPIAWQEFLNMGLDSGRFLTSSDSSGAVIGYRLANESFKRPITIGRRVTIDDRAFTVVGILEEGSGNDNSVFTTVQSAWDVTDVNVGVYSSIEAKVDDVDLVGQVTEELTSALLLSRRVMESEQDFTVSSALAMQEQISEMLGTMTLFLGAIAAVSLLVGAIGVANSMFTAVLEKTKDIGIMKALGSTNREVLTVFLIESGLFGLLGGIIGVLIGILVSGGLSSLLGMNTLVSPQLILIAIALSTVIGVLSGVIPAHSASQLRPVEALRYE